MDTGLKLVVEQCTRTITSYMDSIGEQEVQYHASELFHLNSAKRSLAKCLLASDKYNFNLHKLTRLYDDQLSYLREKFKITE